MKMRVSKSSSNGVSRNEGKMSFMTRTIMMMRKKNKNKSFLTSRSLLLFPLHLEKFQMTPLQTTTLRLMMMMTLLIGLFPPAADGCAISEYYCDNRRCISLDKFCNGVNDCGDGSDEPRYCSPCNRTYYGELGGTYSLAVHRPSSRESQLPYVCQLTFAAGGSKFGDIVQLIFNSVTLGPPLSSDPHLALPTDSDLKNPICNEGHVTMMEPDRPSTAGHWCGQGWGQAVFFSETQRVTLTLSLFSIPVNPGTFAFDFRLSYKFLRKRDSSVRYGPPSNPYQRGQLLPGTFCSLLFQSCDKERCALQTPNFPGLYPRNVTCFYAIRQETAPVGHRAVIKLTQDKEHLIYVRNKQAAKKAGYPVGSTYGVPSSGLTSSSDSSQGRSPPQDVSVGEDCDTFSDHVTIYDGYTIRDPVLLRFCGGGKLPTVTSSGNELLMVFHSAPTDYLLQNFPPSPVQGFHVDVEIKYLPIGSHSYVENHNCFFTISSFQQKRGFLTSPQHSLPDGTTCTYFLQGSPGELVWISLLKFYIAPQRGKSGEDGGVGGGIYAGMMGGGGTGDMGGGSGQQGMGAAGIGGNSPDCNATYLQIWQGTYAENSNNATLLAHVCEDSQIKKTCEFMLSGASHQNPQRACHPEESFISKGPHMTLRLGVETSTVLRPVEFKLYYEFVETRQDGEAFLPPYLSHQTTLNLFRVPNLPRPFVSSSSNFLLGKVGSIGGGGISSNIMGINSASGGVGAGMTLAAAAALGNGNKRANALALRQTQENNNNERNSSEIMMNTQPEPVHHDDDVVNVGISDVSSFTASRLASDTTLVGSANTNNKIKIRKKGNDDGSVGENTGKSLNMERKVDGALSSFASSGIMSDDGDGGVEREGSGGSGGGGVVNVRDSVSNALLKTISSNEAVAAAQVDLNSAAAATAALVSSPNYSYYSSSSQRRRESLPISPKQSCSRIFRTQNRAIQAGSFTSPRNVFFFGRGGVRNLTCIYRFQGAPNERVRLTIDKISLDGGYCKADVEPILGRSLCYPLIPGMGIGGTGLVNDSSPLTEGQVQLWEVPWNDSRIMKECLCSLPNSPFVLTSTSSTMDLVLEIKNMKAFHDPNHFAFEGRYEFLKRQDCSRHQKLRSAGGEILLRIPEKYPYKSCEHFPWEIDPQSPSHYIFLTIPGKTLKKFSNPKTQKPYYGSGGGSFDSSTSRKYSSSSSSSLSSSDTHHYHHPEQGQQQLEHCGNRNRILVYSGGPNGRLLQVICPEDSSSASSHVEIFSEGWHTQGFPNFAENPNQDWSNFASSNQLIVELVSRGSGSTGEYTLKWLQISRKDEPLSANYEYGGITGSIGILSELSPDGITKIVTPLDTLGGPGGSGNTGGTATGVGSVATAGSPSGTSSSSISGGSGSSSAAVGGTSSSTSEELEDDVCFKFKCPELNACISPHLFCDGIQNCPSGYDEADCDYFPIPRSYLYIAAGSLAAIVVLSCCFSCLLCKKKRDERRDKLLSMSSRMPTEDQMFYGTGQYGTGQYGTGQYGTGDYGTGHSMSTLSRSHQREIVC